MRQLSAAGQRVIEDVARRHGINTEATLVMLDALIKGNGQMAQFSHPAFSGSGQWMRGGMTMVSDLFNTSLVARVNALCEELATLIARESGLTHPPLQTQSQSSSLSDASLALRSVAPAVEGDRAHEQPGAPVADSLFVPSAELPSNRWWPSGLGVPASTGSQNGVRYAYFPESRRLVLDIAGAVSVHDTLDHRLGGFSQQQGGAGHLSFHSQHGLVDVGALPTVDGSEVAETPNAVPMSVSVPVKTGPRSTAESIEPMARSTNPRPADESSDIITLIEKLAGLHAKGILTDEEFATKKSELLGRL